MSKKMVLSVTRILTKRAEIGMLVKNDV